MKSISRWRGIVCLSLVAFSNGRRGRNVWSFVQLAWLFTCIHVSDRVLVIIGEMGTDSGLIRSGISVYLLYSMLDACTADPVPIVLQSSLTPALLQHLRVFLPPSFRLIGDSVSSSLSCQSEFTDLTVVYHIRKAF